LSLSRLEIFSEIALLANYMLFIFVCLPLKNRFVEVAVFDDALT
jgi:hypothetical protein